MKKVMTIFGAILCASVILTSCGGPSFCDCNDNYGDLSDAEQSECAKMIDNSSTSELLEKMQDCKNK
jgi:hypothetical protein